VLFNQFVDDVAQAEMLPCRFDFHPVSTQPAPAKKSTLSRLISSFAGHR
jgi:hypothetical protein